MSLEISIHAPRAGCDTSTKPGCVPARVFQSTHPVRGATFQGPAADCGQRDFNPRTPCGVRLIFSQRKSTHFAISIHAPRAGCDSLSGLCLYLGISHFNPRTPCGVRRVVHQTDHETDEFQSTHPVRGATGRDRGGGQAGGDFNPRTPCGVRLDAVKDAWERAKDFNPRTPCGVRRLPNAWQFGMPTDFNPRTPCGVRPLRPDLSDAEIKISIHAPRAGCDGIRHGADGRVHQISIHAPRAGCDII